MSCSVLNVIYVIKCNNCPATYIGETSDLRKRNNLHKNQIKIPAYRHLKVSQHIFNCTKSFDYRIMPFYKMNTDEETARKIKEDYFIRIFQPSLNKPPT